MPIKAATGSLGWAGFPRESVPDAYSGRGAPTPFCGSATVVLVKPNVAATQLAAETAPKPDAAATDGSPGQGPGTTPTATDPALPKPPRLPRRFHGTVQLDPIRTGRDAGEIANEVVSHLVGLVGATVRVTLEIDAVLPSGASDHLVRTVTENCRTLKFTSQGFEEE